MSEKLTFSGVPEPIEIEFLGAEFESAPITRSVQKKAAPLSQKLFAEMYETDSESNLLSDETGNLVVREDSDDDQIVNVLGRLLDLRLRSTNGQTKKPSTLVNAAWKADQLDARSLWDFWSEFRKAEQPEIPDLESTDNRPT